MKWYADQSRYIAGHQCGWRRLLRYHANGTGFTPVFTPPEITFGSTVHSGLEAILKGVLAGESIDSKFINTLYVHNSLTIPTPFTPFGLSEVYGLLHAYARINLPWLLENYDILSTEEEFTLDLGDDIVWMARPDCVVRSKATGLPCIVEFKTTRAKSDQISRIHVGSLQTIMNSYAVSQKYGQPCGEAQIHVLQVGTPAWPTAITHAYYRPAQPPYVQEDWQAKSRRKDGTWLGKLYRRVQVYEHRPIADWIWSADTDTLADLLPITQNTLDPQVNGLKILQAITSIKVNENHWRSRLQNVDWRSATGSELAAIIPRSFECTQYNRDCEFKGYCFSPDYYTRTIDAINDPAGPFDFVSRQPHHPQEGE